MMLDPRIVRFLWRCFERNEAQPLAARLCALARLHHRGLLQTFFEHPMGDDWADFARLALEQHWKVKSGFVYAAVNPAHPRLIKVGQTKSDVARRMKSLATAGVVGAFVPIHASRVVDRFAVEASAHARLMALLGERHKEFFSADRQTVVACIEASAADEVALMQRAGLDVLNGFMISLETITKTQ